MASAADRLRQMKAEKDAEAARQAEVARVAAANAETARQAEAARQVEATRLAQEAEKARVDRTAENARRVEAPSKADAEDKNQAVNMPPAVPANNVPFATTVEDRQPTQEVKMDTTTTTELPVAAKAVKLSLPNPNNSNNNILAKEDKYILTDKATLDAKWSIDTKDVWKKAGYIYGVLDNDIYSDRSSKEKLDVKADNLVVKLVDDVQNGALRLNRDDGTFKYTPNKGFSGEDAFTYQVCKSSLCSNVAMVTITMKNYAPEAKEDKYSIREDSELNANTPNGLLASTGLITYGVLNNDKDKNNNELSADLVSDVKHGTLHFHKDGTFKYTPNKGYSGREEFSYKVWDGIEYSTPAKVYITVERNNPPQAVNDQYKMKQGSTLNADRVIDKTGLGHKIATYGVLSNDVDSNKDPLTAILVEEPKHGRLDFNKDGTFKYSPRSDYSGDDYFTYQASDGTLLSNLATAYIIVSPLSSSEL